MFDVSNPFRLMASSFVYPFVIGCGFLLSSRGLAGQAVLRGRVVADSNGTPISEAEVLVTPSGRSVSSGVTGKFELRELPGGSYRVLIRHIGFRAAVLDLTLKASDTTDIMVRLRAGPLQLEDVVVNAEVPTLSLGLRDLEERRKRISGKFLNADEVRALEPRTLTDILRRWGVTIRRDPRTGSLNAFSPRGSTSLQNLACPMQFWLDGVPLIQPPLVDLRSYPLQTLGGIEVYVGISETPIRFEFGPDASCGVVVMWTRDR